MDNWDGITIEWSGHLIFRDKKGGELFIHHMFIFFEIFSIVLIDGDGIIRIDIPLRNT